MKVPGLSCLHALPVVLAMAWASLRVVDGLDSGKLLADAKGQQDWLTTHRRHLHQWPELMFEEYNTSKYIRDRLDELGITYRHPIAKTGIVASLGKGKPVVGLRADFDALPIQEQTDVPFRSKVIGKMHACGHDSHVAMLLGAAKLLKQHEQELQGTVKLFFQPAEEGGAGGDLMVKEGATKGLAAMFGMHVWPTLETGKLASRAGPFMAAAQQFQVTIRGRGSHAAMPHLGIDPILAAVHTIAALQLLVSRETKPVGSAVVSVTKIQAGEGAYNVIPDDASFGGTIRSLEHEHVLVLKRRFAEVVEHQSKALGCTASVDWLEEQQPYYPPTVNDPGAYKFAVDVGQRLLGDASKFQQDFEPTMGGEDFSFYGHAGIPSAYVFLGTRNEAVGAVHGLHTPKFTIDENILPVGAAYHAALAVDFLAGKGLKRDEL